MTFAAWQQEATTSSEMSLRSGTRDAVIANDASKESRQKLTKTPARYSYIILLPALYSIRHLLCIKVVCASMEF